MCDGGGGVEGLGEINGDRECRLKEGVVLVVEWKGRKWQRAGESRNFSVFFPLI